MFRNSLYINVEHRRCIYSTNKTYKAITHTRNVCNACTTRTHMCAISAFTCAHLNILQMRLKAPHTHIIYEYSMISQTYSYIEAPYMIVRGVWYVREPIVHFPYIYNICLPAIHTFTGGSSSTPNKIYIYYTYMQCKFFALYINFPFPHIHLLSSLNSARIIYNFCFERKKMKKNKYELT